MIRPPLQIRFIVELYRLSAVCNKQIEQKQLKYFNTANAISGFPKLKWKMQLKDFSSLKVIQLPE